MSSGDHVRCYLDGNLSLDAEDVTFQGTGKVGLWTRADAQTYFANPRVKEDKL